MSGLRVPVFFGSILTLVVLIIQNRTPVFQLTLLGIRSQPLSLGILVSIAVVAGIVLGAVLQRTSPRKNPRSRASSSASSSSSAYAGPAEYQPFRSIPEQGTSADDDFDDIEQPPDIEQPSDNVDPSQSNDTTKGWNTEASNSWTAHAEKLEEEGRFWSQPRNSKTSKGNVTPIESRRKRPEPSRDSVVDAEYRIVQPESSGNNDGFDDNFFDDFFEEEDA